MTYVPTREDDAWWAEQMGYSIEWVEGEPCTDEAHSRGGRWVPYKVASMRYVYWLKPYATAPTWETTMGEIVPWMATKDIYLALDTVPDYQTDHCYFYRLKPTRGGNPVHILVHFREYSSKAIMHAAAWALGRANAS